MSVGVVTADLLLLSFVVLQVTCNVHGVAGVFLDIGRAKAQKPPAGTHRFTKVGRVSGET